MGGGNGQKSAAARARKQEKLKKQKSAKSTKYDSKVQSDQKAFKCKICMQTFMVTAKKPVLEAHVTSKHSGKTAKTFEQCFPDFGKAKAPVAKVVQKTKTKEQLKAERK